MGTPISTGVLRALRRLYQLGSSGIPSVERLDEASPIQLVHDVRRHAELGNGLYYLVTEVVSHAGATTERGTIAVDTLLAADSAIKLPDDYECWVSRITGRASNPTVSAMNVGCLFPSNLLGTFAVGSARTFLPLARFTATPSYEDSGDVSVLTPNTANYQAHVEMNLPCRIPRGGIVTYRSTATGATDITLALHLWIAPAAIDPLRGL